jgi:hypothetical protein
LDLELNICYQNVRNHEHQMLHYFSVMDYLLRHLYVKVKLKVKQARYRPEQARYRPEQSRYRPEQAQRVVSGIALSFRDLGARRGVCSASRPGRFTPGKTRYW